MNEADKMVADLVITARRSQAASRRYLVETEEAAARARANISTNAAVLAGLESHAAALNINLSAWDLDGEIVPKGETTA